jgi:hypothetical protein
MDWKGARRKISEPNPDIKMIIRLKRTGKAGKTNHQETRLNRRAYVQDITSSGLVPSA